MSNTDNRNQAPIFPTREEPTGAFDAGDGYGADVALGAEADAPARRRRAVIGALIAVGAVLGLAVGTAYFGDDSSAAPVAASDWVDSATDKPLLEESNVPVPKPTPETPETTPPDWTLPEFPEIPDFPEDPDVPEAPEEGPEEPVTPPGDGTPPVVPPADGGSRAPAEAPATA